MPLTKHSKAVTPKEWIKAEAAKEDLSNLVCVVPETNFIDVKAINTEKLQLDGVVSTESKDRHGDIIRVAGWKLDAYEKNPVVLFGHSYRGLPVAQSLGLKTRGKKLFTKDQFTPEETYEFGHTVFQLMAGEFLRAFSVGFKPLKTERIEDKDGHWIGIEFLEQEKLEHSVVPIPANSQCLVGAKSMGIDLEPLKEYYSMMLDEMGEDGKWLWIPRDQFEDVYKITNGDQTSITVGELTVDDGTDVVEAIGIDLARNEATSETPFHTVEAEEEESTDVDPAEATQEDVGEADDVTLAQQINEMNRKLQEGQERCRDLEERLNAIEQRDEPQEPEEVHVLNLEDEPEIDVTEDQIVGMFERAVKRTSDAQRVADTGRLPDNVILGGSQ